MERLNRVILSPTRKSRERTRARAQRTQIERDREQRILNLLEGALEGFYYSPDQKPSNQTCPQCGSDSLSITVHRDGSVEYCCQVCKGTDEPFQGRLLPARKGQRGQLHWYDTLTPLWQSVFAYLLREQCRKLSDDAKFDCGLMDTNAELDEDPLFEGDALVRQVWEAAKDDKRTAKAWNLSVQSFRAECRIAEKAAKEVTAQKGWPPNWILNDRTIQANLSRAGNSRLLDLYKILVATKIPYKRTVSEDWKWSNGRRPVLHQVPYDKMQSQLGLSHNQTERCIRALAAWKIIRDCKAKSGPRGQKFWASGYWSIGLIPRPTAFLKNNAKIRRALREIDVYRDC